MDAVTSAREGFDGMPLVILERPTWLDIVPTDDVIGRPVQRVWRMIVAPLRLLCVAILMITERWYVFAFMIASIIGIFAIYITR